MFTNLSLTRAFSQIAGLPLHLQLWLTWLVLSTLVIPLFLLGNDFFAAMMICQICNLIFGSWLMLRFGLVRLLGLAHVLFWTPMIAKFAWYYGSLDQLHLVVIGWIVIATIAVSLWFDFRDVISWLRGDRAPLVKV